MTTATDTRARFYQENGFYIHPQPLIDADAVAAAKSGIEELRKGNYETGVSPAESPWNPGDDPNKLCKIEQPQLSNHAIRRAISSPALGRLAAELTGASTIQVWWVQLLYKPSAPQGVKPAKVGYHQDAQYWIEWEPGSELFTAWMGLSDVDEESGPMKFVPRTHTHGLLEGGDFFSDELESQQAAFKLPPGVTWEEVSATMEPGGASFHHRHLIHGSSTNRSGRPRISFAIHLRTEKSTLASGVDRVLTRYVDDHEVSPVIYKA